MQILNENRTGSGACQSAAEHGYALCLSLVCDRGVRSGDRGVRSAATRFLIAQSLAHSG